MKNTMKTFAILALAAIFMISCSEEEVKKSMSTEVLASVTSASGTYTLNYDGKGGVSDISYSEGGSTITYTFFWNTDSTVFSKVGKKNGKLVSEAQFGFNSDSLLISHNTIYYYETEDFERNYEFSYTNKVLSAVTINENGVTVVDNAPVTSSDVNAMFDLAEDRTISINYTPGISPLSLTSPYILACFMEQELPIYFATSKSQVTSYNDTSGSWQFNSIEYNVNGDKFVSLRLDSKLYSFNYKSITITE